MDFRISDLRNFIQASSCTTITQAAQKLEISQPALSESIKRLEQDISTTLFYRSRTGIKLTSNGKLFLEKSRKVFESLNALTSEHENTLSEKTIVIGSHATVAQYSIPNALSYLKEQKVDFKIELIHDLSRNIQAEVQKGNIDIGIVVNPTHVPDLIIYKLSDDSVGVWAHPKCDNHNTLICDLNLFQTQSILKKWKKRPTKIISTNSLELICKLVSENIGYGIIPKKAVLLTKVKLKELKELPSFNDELALIYRPEFGKNRSEKIILDAFKQSIS